MSKDRLSEVVLPRRVQPQPTPDINPGGDCGACVLGGALGISVERVYDELKGERASIAHYEMGRMLRVAESNGLADRIVDRPAYFRQDFAGGGLAVFGEPAWLAAHAWHKYVQAMVDAGYYGIAQVDHSRKGLDGDGSNHWVLICGARTGIKWKIDNRGIGSGEYIKDVLVSCSARSSGMRDEWLDATDFLKYRGGYNLLFIRPAQ